MPAGGTGFLVDGRLVGSGLSPTGSVLAGIIVVAAHITAIPDSSESLLLVLVCLGLQKLAHVPDSTLPTLLRFQIQASRRCS